MKRSNEEIEQSMELARQATPGWRSTAAAVVIDDQGRNVFSSGCGVAGPIRWAAQDYSEAKANADFTAAARNNYLTDLSDLLAMRKEVERLKDALGLAIGAMEHADWSNGVTDSTGTIDEGVVRFCELRDELLKALHPREQH